MLFLRSEEDIHDRNFLIDKDIIPQEEKLRLLNRVMLDRRLNAKDFKIYLFFLNVSRCSYTQEEIADILDLTRENVNRSIYKLSVLNYIGKEQERKRAVMQYSIIRNNSGIFSGGLDILNIDVSRTKDRLNFEDMLSLDSELAQMKQDILERIHRLQISIGSEELNRILSDSKSLTLLLIAYSTNKKLANFKNKFLENTIKFHLQHDEFENSELFLQMYYMFSDNKSYTLSDLLLLANATHRDCTETKVSITELLEESRREYVHKIKDLQNDFTTNERLNTVLNCKLDNNSYNEEEFIFLMHACSLGVYFKKYVGIGLEDYTKIKALWMSEILKNIEV